ncbi:hypothetical protein [Aporhodopirellula aestuarii]|uniref:Uncharacterized protein n=1 Tax=Aporhodopirellula aestuarii TaxID=2950107 RepID=A0ABT0U5C1_9BACT|nr:hypothetical protein [Aporhodopirellula aestuarii]MCM2371859.1 hypothetical protein [Aporhodopirellula aestuarii]
MSIALESTTQPRFEEVIVGVHIGDAVDQCLAGQFWVNVFSEFFANHAIEILVNEVR